MKPEVLFKFSYVRIRISLLFDFMVLQIWLYDVCCIFQTSFEPLQKAASVQWKSEATA